MTKKSKRKPLDAEADFSVPTKQQRLSGMEDAGIQELEDAARVYAATRDRRITLNQREKDQKNLVHALLKKHGKRGYRHNGVEVEIVVETETVKVRILAPGDKPKGARNAVSDTANTRGEDNADEDSAPPSGEEQSEVAGASAQADEETVAAGAPAEDDGEGSASF